MYVSDYCIQNLYDLFEGLLNKIAYFLKEIVYLCIYDMLLF